MPSDTSRGDVVARKGFFPVVIGRDVDVREGGGAVFIARRNLAVSRGGGQWLLCGGDQTVEQGGGAVLISRSARITNGFVALVVAGRSTFEGGARALVSVSAPMALVAGLAAGLAAGLLVGGRLSGRGPGRADVPEHRS